MAWLMVSTFGYALALPFLQDDRTRQRNQGAQNRRTAPASRPSAQNGNQVRNQPRNGNNAAKDGDKKSGVNAQPLLISEDTIPDSLLHPRWQIQRTQPFSLSDLYQSPLDLKRPDALKYDVIQRYYQPLHHRQQDGQHLALGSYHAHSGGISRMD